MARLEAKNKMSPVQLAIVIFMIMVGVPGRLPVVVIKEAGHAAWLCILLAAGLFYGMAWLMLKLGEAFPQESFAEYMPRLWGRWPGGAAVTLFVVLYFTESAYFLHSMSREITFFMFDRTPFEVVEASMLLVCAYGALQEWGTILRVVQFLFFTAFPVWLLLVAAGLISFRFINFLPLWPAEASGVVSGLLKAGAMYVGYESLLVLLPLVDKKRTKPAVTVAWAFVLATGVFLLWVAVEIGVLTLDGAKSAPFPLLTVVRNAEIPGTFLERLDTYFLLFWAQAIFVAIMLSLYLMAEMLTQLFKLADHRPLVLALIPPMFAVSDAAHNVRVYDGLLGLTEGLSLLLSLAVIPASIGLLWWRRRPGDGRE